MNPITWRALLPTNFTDFVNEPEYKRRGIQLIRYCSFNPQIIE